MLYYVDIMSKMIRSLCFGHSLQYVPRYSDAFGVDILGGDGLLQLLQLSSLLQLLHQTLHCLLTPFLLLSVLLALLPAQKSLYNRWRERQYRHL